MYNTIAEIKAANRAAGFHWFDPSTIRFFRSRIAPGVYGGKYFVSSEQFVSSDGVADARLYSVRVASPDGDVNSVGEFQRYATLAKARAEIRRLLWVEANVDEKVEV